MVPGNRSGARAEKTPPGVKYLLPPTLAAMIFRSIKYGFRPRPVVQITRERPPVEPIVSVIIPTYNWSSVLRIAIQSVLWQTEQNFELIAVGDGCTDDSGSVVAGFNDGRIIWHNLPTNSGHQAAPNNAGLALARGRYIALLGHDDVWHPEHLRTMLNAALRKNADVVSALTQMIGPAGTNFRVVNGFYPRGGYDGSRTLVPSGIMVRRKIAQKIGGWRDYRTIPQNPDLEFAHRAWAARSRFVSTGELTVFKFNSALRKNSYREKRSDEQAAYFARIQNDRWFMLREVLAIAHVHFLRLPIAAPQFSAPPDSQTLGWEVAQFRKFRGLE
jgi:glycosyltransferase involved in cell wall biosynthesis